MAGLPEMLSMVREMMSGGGEGDGGSWWGDCWTHGGCGEGDGGSWWGDCWTHGKGKGKGKGKEGKGKGKWPGKRSMGGFGPMQQTFVKKKEGTGPTTWVNTLNYAMNKKVKRLMNKDDILYIFNEEEENLFSVTVTSMHFVKSCDTMMYTSISSLSWDEAKEDAARIATESEFPDVYATLQARIPKAPQNIPRPQEKAAKTMMNESLGAILGRPPNRDDVRWQGWIADDSFFHATLQIPQLHYDTFDGVGESKKEAEEDASYKAWVALEPMANEKRAEKIAAGVIKKQLTPEEKAKKKREIKILKTIEDSKKAHVSGVDETITESELRTFFSQVGHVQLLVKLSDASAVVVFNNAGDIGKAISMFNGMALKHCSINISEWLTRYRSYDSNAQWQSQNEP